MKSCNWILLSGVAAAAMLASVPAAAADGDQAEAAAADVPAASSTDIIVTATKRAQNVQDVPISMVVVSGEQLSKFNISDARAMMNYTPNVFVQTTAGNNVIYIRGFGSPPANFAFDQSVSLYVDGIYAGRSRQAEAPFFDLQRVEVLRGANGFDRGALALGGALGTIAVIVRQEIVLAVMGGVFVLEALSVMAQVSWFKYTKRKYGEGRRILLMAPLHHHYEKKGWKETQVVVRFWIITMLLCLVGLSSLKLR